MAKIKEITLPINQIIASSATQVRKRIDPSIVKQYAEDMTDGAIFPPVVIFNDGGEYNYLADGFHRIMAHTEIGVEEIRCEVHEGGLHDALIFACGTNAIHGARRTNADKRNAVELCLKDPEISQRKPQEIADICRVNERTVRRIRLEVDEAARTKKAGKGGGEKQQASPKDNRPSRVPPTQEEVSRTELREAINTIRAFPFGGEDILERVAPLEEKGDRENLEYVSAWCAHAALVLRPKE